MFQPWNTSQRAKRPGQVSACGHSWQIACPGWQIAFAGWQIACPGWQIACAGWQITFVSCCGQLAWLVLAGRLLLFFCCQITCVCVAVRFLILLLSFRLLALACDCFFGCCCQLPVVVHVCCCSRLLVEVVVGRLLLLCWRLVARAGYYCQIIYAAWLVVVGHILYMKKWHIEWKQNNAFYVPSHLVNQLFVLFFAILLKIK